MVRFIHQLHTTAIILSTNALAMLFKVLSQKLVTDDLVCVCVCVLDKNNKFESLQDQKSITYRFQWCGVL